MKNKLSKLIAACLITVSLAACGGSNSSDDRLDSIHSNRVESNPIGTMGQVDDDFIIICYHETYDRVYRGINENDRPFSNGFLRKINEAIGNGYEPVGPVCHGSYADIIFYWQSMVKEKSK